MAVGWVGYGGSTLLGNVLTMAEGAGSGIYSDSLPSGKYYFEFDQTLGADYLYLGCGGQNYPYNWATNPSDVAYATAALYNPTVSRCGMAIDVDTGEFWIRDQSGNWTQGDPELGTVPFTLPGSFTEIRIAMGNAGAGAGTMVFELFTTSSNFTYSIPSGFTALDGSDFGSAIDAIGNQDGAYEGTPTLGQDSLIPSDTTGKSVGFSGDDYIDLATNRISPAIDEWTIVMVIKTGSDVTNPFAFMAMNDTYSLYVYQSKLQIWTGAIWYDQIIPVSSNTTYLVTLTQDSSGNVQFYLDGTSVGSPISAANISLSPKALGTHTAAPGGATQWWNGFIDDTIIYDFVLSGTQISNLRSKMLAVTGTYLSEVLSFSPTAYYRLNESSGSIIEDYVGTNDGTYVAVTFNETSLVPSDSDTCIKLSSVRDNLIPNHSGISVGTGDYTILFWVKIDIISSDGDERQLLDLRNAGGTVGWLVQTGGFGGSTVGCLRFIPPTGDTLESTALLDDGNAHFCAITRESNTLKIYVDGSLEASGSDTTNYSTTTGNVTLGYNSYADAGQGRLTGWLDEIGFYDTALSATNISDIYTLATTI